jgi:RNA polymerase sigma-70 factor (ECF subfamily)
VPRDSAERGFPAGAKAPADEALATAAAAGDEAAFVALIERHYDRFHRLAWRWCGNSGDAEDVAQDVCIKLASAIRGWRGEAAFTTWATRIVYTTAIDRLRARQRLRLVEPSIMAALVEASGDAPGLSDAEQRLLDGELWDEVRRLPDQQRDAVLLVYGEDMSHAEAAAVMGCTEKTVSWHLHEARKRLKLRLEAAG